MADGFISDFQGEISFAVRIDIYIDLPIGLFFLSGKFLFAQRRFQWSVHSIRCINYQFACDLNAEVLPGVFMRGVGGKLYQ